MPYYPGYTGPDWQNLGSWAPYAVETPPEERHGFGTTGMFSRLGSGAGSLPWVMANGGFGPGYGNLIERGDPNNWGGPAPAGWNAGSSAGPGQQGGAGGGQGGGWMNRLGYMLGRIGQGMSQPPKPGQSAFMNMGSAIGAAGQEQYGNKSMASLYNKTTGADQQQQGAVPSQVQTPQQQPVSHMSGSKLAEMAKDPYIKTVEQDPISGKWKITAPTLPEMMMQGGSQSFGGGGGSDQAPFLQALRDQWKQ